MHKGHTHVRTYTDTHSTIELLYKNSKITDVFLISGNLHLSLI